MTTVKAHFDGRVFIPEQPVDLLVGQAVEIPIPPPAKASRPTCLGGLAAVLEALPSNPDWPADGATQHDHYLYGSPKKP
jgi:hypothetical protein